METLPKSQWCNLLCHKFQCTDCWMLGEKALKSRLQRVKMLLCRGRKYGQPPKDGILGPSRKRCEHSTRCNAPNTFQAGSFRVQLHSTTRLACFPNTCAR